MKRRSLEPAADTESAEAQLFRALLSLRTESELAAFFHDLCTPAELEAMADRWQVVAPLCEGLPYREIHDRTAVSVTTIGRVARCLSHGAGGYRLAADRLGLHRDGTATPA